MDSQEDSGGSRRRGGARPRAWPIAGGVVLAALAGVLMATPYLARAEPGSAVGRSDGRRGLGPAPPGSGAMNILPDAGAADEPAAPTAEPSSDPGRKVTGYVELLPDVGIRCLAVPRNTDRAGRSHDPRLLCAEVDPRSRRARGPFKSRPFFWV